MTNTSNLTTEQFLWKLAGAKRECPNLYLHTMQDSPDNAVARSYTCKVCQGTGQVYVLSAIVRVPCWVCLITKEPYGVIACPAHPGKGHCANCHGLGYTPSESLEVWAMAAWDIMGDLSDTRLPEAALRRNYIMACAQGDLLGALQALAMVLENNGVKLEVFKW